LRLALGPAPFQLQLDLADGGAELLEASGPPVRSASSRKVASPYAQGRVGRSCLSHSCRMRRRRRARGNGAATPTALEELAECLDDPECAAELGEQLEQGATTVAEEEDPNAAFTEEAKDVQTDVIEAVRKEPGFNLDAAIESGYGSEVERHCRRSAAPLGASSQKYSTTTAR
jgi:hypothetical protein